MSASPWNFRCCPLCGWIWVGPLGLCSFCWPRLCQQRLEHRYSTRVFAGLVSTALWDWDGDNDCLLRRFLLSLKGGRGSRPLWQELAAALVSRVQPLPRAQEPWVIVPSPPRNQRQIDHAGRLARELVTLLRQEEALPLRRLPTPKRQKQLARGARMGNAEQAIQMDRLPGKTFTNVIFVDDVITTGATARAAWLSLGRPERFVVWSLARRLLTNA